MLPSSALTGLVRRADPDRFFCTLLAPAAAREALLLLYAFNHELARAREVASQPMLARIRLMWWREVVQGAVRQHEIAAPLGAAISAGVFEAADLLALIEAREAEAEDCIPDFDGFMNYVRGTAGRLMRIAGKTLGVDHVVLEDLGTAYGISGILRAEPFLARQQRSVLPADGTPPHRLVGTARALLRVQPPRAALAAALPAVYARRDLGKPYAPRSLADRLAVVRAAVRGRI